jgi:outer membrane immunogenic protein
MRAVERAVRASDPTLCRRNSILDAELATMNMRFVVGTAIALVMAGSAHAADLGQPYRMPPPPPDFGPPPRPIVPAQYSWTSCYFGSNFGLGAGHTQWKDTQPDGNIDANAGLARSANTDMSGGLGGAQIGCDYQFGGNWVVGVATSFDISDISGTDMDQLHPAWSLRDHLNWFGTVTGRAGYAVNNVLMYGKGGVVFANNMYEIVNNSAILGEPTPVQTGWTVGGGLEWAFSPNWSAFAEISYYGFGSTTQTFNTIPAAINAPATISISPSFETVTAGINFRFGGD